jgi:nucleotide-binding universal stress UspA family protein
MIIREVLVHLKSHEDWSPHIDYAIGMAKAQDARLRGLVTFAEASFLRCLTRSGDAALAAQLEKDAKIARALEERFAAACKKMAVRADFAAAEGPANEIMPWAARLHDLTIIEQRHPGQDELGYDAAEETALSSGRPVLLVPRVGHYNPSPDHILVAWNGSHQAAAAVQGALPFIARAKCVTVCSGELRLPLRASIRVPPLDIASHLRAHVGEVREEMAEAGPSAIGEYLLGRANELGCGMIVMGVYGRSWFSEYVLGGATRHMLAHMTVPILTGR